jgi:hypothetical protein
VPEQREHQEHQVQQHRSRPITSTFLRDKVQAVARELQHGELARESGQSRLLETRRVVTCDWLATAQALRAQGEAALAREVEAFVKDMPRVRTDRDRIAAGLMAQIDARRERERDHSPPLPRT